MIKKSEFAWNMLGSFVYAMFSAIILAFCTRINGLEIAGIFSIAYATSCILNSIGDFGIRVFQVTDTNRKYKFSSYLSARIIAILIMILVTGGVVLIGGYSSTKLWVCILLMVYRIIDNLSETYQAEFQLDGRLDIAGKSMVFRNLAAIIAFIIVDKLTQNIVVACLCMILINLIIFLLYDVKKIKEFNVDKFKFEFPSAKQIVRECMPIAIAGILNVYVINVVKYAIDSAGDYTMQTYFNIIYMPTFVINLVSIFIIKPFLKMFGEYYNEKKYEKLSKVIMYIVGALILVTICIEIGCFILGVPFLNLFYGVDISNYKGELMILVLSGLFYAMSNLLFNLLGTIRKQKYITIAYLFVCVISLILPNMLVKKYSMTGAAIANLVIMFSLCLILSIFFKIGINKEMKK